MTQRHIICTQGTSISQGVRLAGSMSREQFRMEAEARLAAKRETGSLGSLSAELNSLVAMDAGSGDHVYLVCSETPDGAECAEMTRQIIETELGCHVEVRAVAGLQVSDRDRFCREGIPNLFADLKQILGPQPEYRAGQFLLNVSGGFKGVVPYITLFGLIYRIPVTYIFEFTGTLITLPPTPIHFDWRLISRARDAFTRLRAEGAMPRDRFFELIGQVDHAERARFDALLDADGDLVTASTLGELIFEAQAAMTGPIFVSPAVASTLKEAPSDLRMATESLLMKCADPLWRQDHVHRFKGTDLQVSKPGNVAARLAYTTRGEAVYVAEVYQSHDEYERDLKGRKVADYDLDAFLPWQPSAQSDECPTEAETLLELEQRLESNERALENALKSQQALQRQREQLEQQRERFRNEAEMERRTQKTLQRKLSASQQTSSELQQALRETSERLLNLEAEVAHWRRPWWRRLFTPPPGQAS